MPSPIQVVFARHEMGWSGLRPRGGLSGLMPQTLQEFHGDTPGPIRQSVQAGNTRGVFLIYASGAGPVGISYPQVRSNRIILLSPEIEAAKGNVLRSSGLIALTLFRGAANPNGQSHFIAAGYSAFAFTAARAREWIVRV